MTSSYSANRDKHFWSSLRYSHRRIRSWDYGMIDIAEGENAKGYSWQRRNQLFVSGGANFYEISFDEVVVLIQPWCKFFANGHRKSSLHNISENENFSVLIKMQANNQDTDMNVRIYFITDAIYFNRRYENLSANWNTLERNAGRNETWTLLRTIIGCARLSSRCGWAQSWIKWTRGPGQSRDREAPKRLVQLRKVSHALVSTLQKHRWKTSKVIRFGNLHFSDNWGWPSTAVPRLCTSFVQTENLITTKHLFATVRLHKNIFVIDSLTIFTAQIVHSHTHWEKICLCTLSQIKTYTD